MLWRAATNGGPTISPILPSSVVPRAKMRVKALQIPLSMSLYVAPVGLMVVQLAGIAEVGILNRLINLNQ